MKNLRNSILLIFSCLLMFHTVAAAAPPPMTLSMPAATLKKTLTDLLPMPLEQNSKKFQGTITIDRISELTIRDNLIAIEGQVSGKDMTITTNIGGQDLKLNLGKLVLPVTCDITLRFDTKTRTLFLRPRFQNPTHGKSNSAKTLLPLLNSLGNREYPVRLDSMRPMTAKVGNRKIDIRMIPVDIRASQDTLTIKLLPRTGKSR